MLGRLLCPSQHLSGGENIRKSYPCLFRESLVAIQVILGFLACCEFGSRLATSLLSSQWSSSTSFPFFEAVLLPGWPFLQLWKGQ